MDDDEFVFLRDRERRFDGKTIGGCVEHAAARHQRGRLRKPRWIPERADLALCLITRPRAAVETVVRRCLQK